MIVGTPILFKRTDLIKVSLFYGIPVKKIKEMSKDVVRVNSTEMVRIKNSTLPEVKIVEMSNIFKTKYATYIKATTSELLGLIIHCSPPYAEVSAKEKYIKWESSFSDIAYYEDQIISATKSIQEIIGEYPVWRGYDWKAMGKYAKKLKVGWVKTNDGVELTFKNVKVGNPTEGYLNYRQIKMIFNNSMMLREVISSFRKFTISSKWALPSHYHPHISIDSSSPAMCFGSRAGEVGVYRKNSDGVMLLDAINELIHSYSPDGGPYAPVHQIANYVNQLTKLVGDTKFDDTDEDKARQLVESVASRLSRCGSCQSFLNEDRTCPNENCIRNPHAIINCSYCQQQLIWNTTLRQLVCPGHTQCTACGDYRPSTQEHCSHRDCRANPDYRTSCSHCGADVPANMVCGTPTCINNPAFDDSRPEIMTPPVCRRCGHQLIQHLHTREEMMHNSARNHFLTYYHNWYCDNGCRNDPQYTAWGDVLNVRRIPLSPTTPAPEDELEEIHEDGDYDCPECGRGTDWVPGEGYRCQNEDCDLYETYTHNPDGTTYE